MKRNYINYLKNFSRQRDKNKFVWYENGWIGYERVNKSQSTNRFSWFHLRYTAINLANLKWANLRSHSCTPTHANKLAKFPLKKSRATCTCVASSVWCVWWPMAMSKHRLEFAVFYFHFDLHTFRIILLVYLRFFFRFKIELNMKRRTVRATQTIPGLILSIDSVC